MWWKLRLLWFLADPTRITTTNNDWLLVMLFYRAMHFSAKRGIAIACRLSVCLSVCPSLCDVGELWSHRLKFFENNFTVSMGCSLFATPTGRGWSKGNTPKFGPKVTHPLLIWASEWLQIAQRSQWRAYRKLPSLFLMVSSLTPYDLPFPQNGGSICPQYTQMAISLQRVIRSTSCLVLGLGFRGQRIERRYLRFEQIQDGGQRHVGKISSGVISATGRPIHFMFCSRVGFSGTADL